MNTSQDNTRHFLSYPNATYRRTWNWFIAALVFLAASILLGKLLHRTEFGGPPLLVILAGFGTAVCVVSGISDAIFVYRYKNLVDPVTFDAVNLYVGPDDTAFAIPLGRHASGDIRLVSCATSKWIAPANIFGLRCKIFRFTTNPTSWRHQITYLIRMNVRHTSTVNRPAAVTVPDRAVLSTN
jgi:hypothetical protein